MFKQIRDFLTKQSKTQKLLLLLPFIIICSFCYGSISIIGLNISNQKNPKDSVIQTTEKILSSIKPTTSITTPSQATPTPTQIPLAPTQPSPNVQYSCGAKKTCKVITSCDEAYYQLNICGNHSLDGDNDGVPCETLCR